MENDNKTLAQKLRAIAKAKEERDLTPEEIEIVREAVKQIMPTMKPIPLIARLIVNSSTKGDIVLDTFGGSGTTLLACENQGRVCRMVELDEKYCDVIVQRWEKATGRKAQIISGKNSNNFTV